MPRRKVSDDQLREIVRARLTKGDAFVRFEGPITYTVKQEQIKQDLAKLDRREIFSRYPYLTYDLKQ